MEKADLKRIAVEAAMERVIGASSVPVRYVASLLKEFGKALDVHKAEKQAWKEYQSLQERQYREIEANLTAYATELERVRRIKGEKGDVGKDGKDGRDGKDASPVDIELLVKRVMRLVKQPKDGKSAEIDYEKLAKVVAGKLDISEYKKALDNEVASYRSQLAGKHYGENTWARGSGTTVSAGANITLVPQPNGTVQINASGGGSGTNVVTQYQLTAVQSGSNVTIALSQLTNFATYAGLIAVYRNNIMQTETLNFTKTATVVTVLDADASEIFNITYAYS